jgi:hypothetical protein
LLALASEAAIEAEAPIRGELTPSNVVCSGAIAVK